MRNDLFKEYPDGVLYPQEVSYGNTLKFQLIEQNSFIVSCVVILKFIVCMPTWKCVVIAVAIEE